MNLNLNFPVHAIPLWFLVLSLFLPRICILIAWVQHSMVRFIPPVVGLIPVIVALLIPRILILYWIYLDQVSDMVPDSPRCNSAGLGRLRRIPHPPQTPRRLLNRSMLIDTEAVTIGIGPSF